MTVSWGQKWIAAEPAKNVGLSLSLCLSVLLILWFFNWVPKESDKVVTSGEKDDEEEEEGVVFKYPHLML